MLLLICLMNRGGKESINSGVRVWNWGAVEVFYGNQVTGRHAHQLTVLLGNQILGVFLSAATFRESLPSLFYHCLGKKERFFFFSFVLFTKNIMAVSKKAFPMLEEEISLLDVDMHCPTINLQKEQTFFTVSSKWLFVTIFLLFSCFWIWVLLPKWFKFFRCIWLWINGLIYWCNIPHDFINFLDYGQL